MAEVLSLPPRDPDRDRQSKSQAGGRGRNVVDISRRDAFNLNAVPAIAADFVRLPAARDREAAVAKLIKDFRRTAKVRHGLEGRQLDGAAIAVEASLRRNIREIMEKKE